MALVSVYDIYTIADGPQYILPTIMSDSFIHAVAGAAGGIVAMTAT